jgi:hypothetical protein
MFSSNTCAERMMVKQRISTCILSIDGILSLPFIEFHECPFLRLKTNKEQQQQKNKQKTYPIFLFTTATRNISRISSRLNFSLFETLMTNRVQPISKQSVPLLIFVTIRSGKAQVCSEQLYKTVFTNR